MSSLCSAAGLGRAALLLGFAVLAGCAHAPPPVPADARARLFALALQDIGDIYIEPVSDRRLVLFGLANLSRLDRNLAVVETPASENRTALALTYRDRQLALFSPPADNDGIGWGKVMSQAIAAARAASPIVAAHADERIEDVVFDGMTDALDRFSRYSAPAAARAERTTLEGFSGIGITLEEGNGGFSVGAVLPQSPAARAGVEPGDRIVAIDGHPTAGRPRAEIVGRLHGPLASTVELTVYRPALGRERSLAIRRELVVPPTVAAAEQDGVAIFHITGFSRDTTERLAADLVRAAHRPGPGLRGIVLDLRGDPGGLLEQAAEVSNLFIARGPIAATIGRNPASRQLFAASGAAVAPAVPIVALIDGGSASAAEIVAAALQDARRAVVVGSASYGKGTVQTVLPLPNGGELTLTWALLVRPSGYLLDGHGVIPDVCTSGLAENRRSLPTVLARLRAAPAPAQAAMPAPLDEAAWRRLRRACPARTDGRNLDLGVAERLLADPDLYRDALASSRRPTALTEPPAPLISASPTP
ncbi:MAG TPA: S41 family peptidase [Stellaceae bacterium]|nr:S41 family peptidase [Stellaceae bacterium]